jgi:hypothetical protein
MTTRVCTLASVSAVLVALLSFPIASSASDTRTVAILGLEAHGIEPAVAEAAFDSLEQVLSARGQFSLTERWRSEAAVNQREFDLQNVFGDKERLNDIGERLSADWLVGAGIDRIKGFSRVRLLVAHGSKTGNVAPFETSGAGQPQDLLKSVGLQATNYMEESEPGASVGRWKVVFGVVSAAAVLAAVFLIDWPPDEEHEPLPEPPGRP